MHGIESDGKDFLKSATAAAENEDVVVRQKRDGSKNLYRITKNKQGKNVRTSVDSIKDVAKNGRLHVVYDSEQKNEHRQETSDDLTEKLTEMGLINDQTQLDMFVHSNVYTDMKGKALAEDINRLKTTNPKLYQELQEKDITAIVGNGISIVSDNVVSIKSQAVTNLEGVVSDRLSLRVDGLIGHLKEVGNNDFIEFISKVNKSQTE